MRDIKKERAMKTLLIAGVLAMLPAAAGAQTATPAPAAAPAAAEGTLSVYDKALQNGWQHWAWDGATIELSADIGSPRMPIKVEAEGWKGLYLHHDGFATNPYRGINMLIQVVGGDANVRVIAIKGGKPVPDGDKLGADGQPLPKMKLVSLTPGGWKKVQVPLRDLGAEDMTIDGLWIQNDSGQKAPNFYVADIAFMR